MKGFYSVIIGLIVLLVLSTALFTVTSFNKSQALIPQKESFGYTIRTWQNTRYVLDKATADAIIDTGFAARCLTIDALVAEKFNDTNILIYDFNIISNMDNGCVIEKMDGNNVKIEKRADHEIHSVGERNVFDVNVFFTLKCRHHAEIGIDLNSLASYSKNVLFEKTVDANFNSTTNDCNIFVLDKQSGLIDINYFVPV